MIQGQSSLKDLLFFHQIMAACKNSANPNGPVTRSRIKPSFFICYTLERLWPLPQPKRLRCDIVHGHLAKQAFPPFRSSPWITRSFHLCCWRLIISLPLNVQTKNPQKHAHADVLGKPRTPARWKLNSYLKSTLSLWAVPARVRKQQYIWFVIDWLWGELSGGDKPLRQFLFGLKSKNNINSL